MDPLNFNVFFFLTTKMFSTVKLSLKALISSQCVVWKSCVVLNELFFYSFKIDLSGMKGFVQYNDHY